MKSKTENFLHSATHTPLSLIELRQFCQLDLPFFTRTTGEAASKHPLFLSTRANFLGLEIGAGKDLEDGFTLVTNFTSFEGPNHQIVAYGEYTKYDEAGSMQNQRHVFMAMIERTLDPDLPEAEITGTDEDFIHLPHVAFHGIIRVVKGEERVEPLAMTVALGYDSEDFPVTASLRNNDELGRGLCYADSVLWQILSGQPIVIEDNIRWMQDVEEFQVLQKLEWMKTRSYKDAIQKPVAQISSTPENAVATGPVI